MTSQNQISANVFYNLNYRGDRAALYTADSLRYIVPVEATYNPDSLLQETERSKWHAPRSILRQVNSSKLKLEASRYVHQPFLFKRFKPNDVARILHFYGELPAVEPDEHPSASGEILRRCNRYRDFEIIQLTQVDSPNPLVQHLRNVFQNFMNYEPVAANTHGFARRVDRKAHSSITEWFADFKRFLRTWNPAFNNRRSNIDYVRHLNIYEKVYIKIFQTGTGALIQDPNALKELGRIEQEIRQHLVDPVEPGEVERRESGAGGGFLRSLARHAPSIPFFRRGRADEVELDEAEQAAAAAAARAARAGELEPGEEKELLEEKELPEDEVRLAADGSALEAYHQQRSIQFPVSRDEAFLFLQLFPAQYIGENASVVRMYHSIVHQLQQILESDEDCPEASQELNATVRNIIRSQLEDDLRNSARDRATFLRSLGERAREKISGLFGVERTPFQKEVLESVQRFASEYDINTYISPDEFQRAHHGRMDEKEVRSIMDRVLSRAIGTPRQVAVERAQPQPVRLLTGLDLFHAIRVMAESNQLQPNIGTLDMWTRNHFRQFSRFEDVMAYIRNHGDPQLAEILRYVGIGLSNAELIEQLLRDSSYYDVVNRPNGFVRETLMNSQGPTIVRMVNRMHENMGIENDIMGRGDPEPQPVRDVPNVDNRLLDDMEAKGDPGIEEKVRDAPLYITEGDGRFFQQFMADNIGLPEQQAFLNSFMGGEELGPEKIFTAALYVSKYPQQRDALRNRILMRGVPGVNPLVYIRDVFDPIMQSYLRRESPIMQSPHRAEFFRFVNKVAVNELRQNLIQNLVRDDEHEVQLLDTIYREQDLTLQALEGKNIAPDTVQATFLVSPPDVTVFNADTFEVRRDNIDNLTNAQVAQVIMDLLQYWYRYADSRQALQ